MSSTSCGVSAVRSASCTGACFRTRAIVASACTWVVVAFFGEIRRKMKRLRFPSRAPKSMPSGTRAKAAASEPVPSLRQWGTATPSSRPVPFSFSLSITSASAFCGDWSRFVRARRSTISRIRSSFFVERGRMEIAFASRISEIFNTASSRRRLSDAGLLGKLKTCLPMAGTREW